MIRKVKLIGWSKLTHFRTLHPAVALFWIFADTLSQIVDSKLLVEDWPTKNLDCPDFCQKRSLNGESAFLRTMLWIPNHELVGCNSESKTVVVRGQPYQLIVVKPSLVSDGNRSTNLERASLDIRA